MTTTRFVRGSNSRMLAYLSGLLLCTASFFLYHNARVEVEAEKEALAKCQQAQESLSAQLQVIFEYKVRLEKNLNEERNRHQETKDKLQAHLSEEQEKNKENQEAINKFSALQQQYKLLRTQNEDLRGECEKDRTTCKAQYKALEQKSATELEKLKGRFTQVQEEADDYRRQLVDLQNDLKKTDGQSDTYIKENIQLKRENENLREQIAKLEKRLKGIHSSTDRGGAGGGGGVGPSGGRGGAQGGSDLGALPAPNNGRQHSPSSSTPTPDGRQGMNAIIEHQLAASNSKALGKHSTTPQINPEALLSQEKAGAGAGAHAVGAAPPVAPAPPSQGPKHSAQSILKSKESFQEAQQQQVGVLAMPFAFQDNQQGGVAPVPAVVPALAPPQQNVLHAPQLPEVPSNQGQQPPLDEGAMNNGFNAPIPIQRNFAAQRENEDWMAAFHRPMPNQRRKPVAAPMEARAREDRQRAEWDRQQAPFQDYDKDLHAGENEEDDDDDADQMDNAVNQEARAPQNKKFGANKFFGRNDIMVNPR